MAPFVLLPLVSFRELARIKGCRYTGGGVQPGRSTMSRVMGRREFVQTAAAAAILAQGQVAKAQPSERIRVGCVGVRGRAGYLLSAFAANKEVELVAIADVDSRNLPGGIEAVQKIQ